MKITLDNIGIVKDSEIVFDGLTVITGKNNSGKTTVGKTLYALFNSVSNIKQKSRIDKMNYINKVLHEIADELEILGYYVNACERYDNDCFKDYPALKRLFFGANNRKFEINSLDKYAYSLFEELNRLEVSTFDEVDFKELSKFYRLLSTRHYKNQNEKIDMNKVFKTQINKSLTILTELFENLQKDPELINYTRESIDQTLKIEFSGQIQPVNNLKACSEITVSNLETLCFSLKIRNNNVVNDGMPVYFSSPIQDVYFIDNPFILDDFYFRTHRVGYDVESEDGLVRNCIYSHNEKNKMAIRRPKAINIFEKTVVEESLKKVKEKIDLIIPGTFEFSSEGNYYVQNGVKLKASNLATGSKMFSIIKILLEKGLLNERTLLILDEPEAHLHPQWQNKFAEIMALLVKYLDVRILLTTHSSNFVLALDASMRKYGIQDRTNFYQTCLKDEGMIQYECLNDDMGKIYQDFLTYLSEAKALREKYYFIGEIDD